MKKFFAMYIFLQLGTIFYMYIDVSFGGLFQNLAIIIAITSIWLPQIISNMTSTKFPKPPGSTNYTIAMTLNIVHFQIYTKSYCYNLFGMHIDPKFTLYLTLWFLAQIILHKLSLLNPMTFQWSWRSSANITAAENDGKYVYT